MDRAEFDKFAVEYRELHSASTRISGYSPEYFAEAKVRDVAGLLAERCVAPERLLDFGAGTGMSVPFFRRYLPHVDLTCIDVSRASLDLGEARFGDQANFIEFDGITIPFADGTFDIAFAACVFHHIGPNEHVRLFRELRRVVKPGGYFFLYEHNPMNPLTVRAVRACEFDENAVLIGRRVARRRLRQAGFREIETRFRIFVPGYLRALRSLERYLSWCPLGAQYVMVAKAC